MTVLVRKRIRLSTSARKRRKECNSQRRIWRSIRRDEERRKNLKNREKEKRRPCAINNAMQASSIIIISPTQTIFFPSCIFPRRRMFEKQISILFFLRVCLEEIVCIVRLPFFDKSILFDMYMKTENFAFFQASINADDRERYRPCADVQRSINIEIIIDFSVSVTEGTFFQTLIMVFFSSCHFSSRMQVSKKASTCT